MTISWVAVSWTVSGTIVSSTESMSYLKTLVIVMRLVRESDDLWLIDILELPVAFTTISLDGHVSDWEMSH
jgi:hypothetical protein